MCMTFGFNPQINFSNFFTVRTYFFGSLKHIDTWYLVNAAPSTILTGSFINFIGVFVLV